MTGPGFRYVVSALVALCTVHGSASAQTTGSSPASRFDVSVGVGLLGGAAMGQQAADERAGGTAASYRLFESDTILASSRTIDLRVGVAITPRVSVEGRAGLGHPELRTAVSSDAEGAPAITAVERIDQYTFDGGLAVRLNEWRFLGLVPFASGGAGYLRQLHEGQTLVEEGQLYYAGGGVTRELLERGRGLVRSAGLRADVRLYVFSGVVSLGDRWRRQGAFSGRFFVAF